MHLDKPVRYTSPKKAQIVCRDIRERGLRIGFIATMGALHEGHASLIRQARQENDYVIVSIFINPLQFNNAEDLLNYPRNDKTDIALLKALKVDAVFTGSAEEFLGETRHQEAESLPSPGIYAQGLEGTHRPGHFEGVREIVSRLFTFVGPCRAYFGEKDYQQLQIIRQLADEMMGIQVIGCATSRENSGLARSSRNVHLSAKGLQQATIIYKAMRAANQAWERGVRQPDTLQNSMLKVLAHSSITLEYAEIRDPQHWSAKQPEQKLTQARALIAGQIEGIRLIDNMALGSIGQA